MPFVPIELRQAAADQLGQGLTRSWALSESPVTVDADERVRGTRRQEELVRVEHVALRGVVDPLAGALLNRPVENCLDQLYRVRFRQRLEFQALRTGILPERLHRVRTWFRGPDRGQDEGGAGHRELEDQRRRGRVEPLRVVDADYDRAALGVLPKGPGGALQLQQLIVRPGIRRKKLRASRQRHRRRAPRALHPADHGTGPVRRRDGLASQP